MPVNDLEIAKSYANSPPFNAIACAYDLGIHIAYAPIPSAIECHFQRKPYIFRVSKNLQSSPRKLRLAVSVGIAHYLMHRDLMAKEEPHGDAIFKEFTDTGRPLAKVYEDQAMRVGMDLMVKNSILDAVIRRAKTTSEALEEIQRTFNISYASARIFLNQTLKRDPSLILSSS